MNESNGKVVWEYAIAVAVAVVIALLVRLFLIEAYRIPSQSMKPTLLAGDTIFVSKWPFGLRLPGSAKPFMQGRLPKRGEVVVFSSQVEPGRDYIKRVIALPGEKVEIKGGKVLLNGKTLEIHLDRHEQKPIEMNLECGSEKFPSPDSAEHGVCWEPPTLEDMAPTVVPADSLFVLGDLRSAGEGRSRQSIGESLGLIPLGSLKGSALWIWLSVEPRTLNSEWLPRFRVERMFRRIK